jgi:N-acetylmuramic acid 6-phosphate etherase
MAGGPKALLHAVEGAEDHPERAAWELRERGLSAGDAVVAISASGRTPFTLGSLDAAHEVGARTIALTCNPGSPLAEAAEVAIVPAVGPEVIAGSTRMKGGLAQKMVLHLLSTTTMVKLGYVAGNLMSNLRPASDKLRDRALRIIMSLGDLGQGQALALLDDCENDVGEATRRARALTG